TCQRVFNCRFFRTFKIRSAQICHPGNIFFQSPCVRCSTLQQSIPYAIVLDHVSTMAETEKAWQVALPGFWVRTGSCDPSLLQQRLSPRITTIGDEYSKGGFMAQYV